MVNCQKKLFHLPDDVSYLNVAYMSPLLKSVETAGHRGVSRKNLPYELSIGDFFEPTEQLKQLYAQLIDVEDKDRIGLIPSVSYGMANVANNLSLKSGEQIILVEEQFPSNVYAWEEVARKSGADLVFIPSPLTIDKKADEWNEAILDAIDERTAMVALPHVHWSEGVVYDLKSIRDKTRRFGALMVIDGTQSVGALPFSVKEFQPDALICAAYKWLLGPYSFGMAYYGEAFDNGLPIEENWINRLNSEDFAGLVNYQPLYKPKAQRYSVGEQSNFIAIPMQIKALEQLLEWGVNNIQNYAGDINRQPLLDLKKIGFGVSDESQRSNHLVGVKMPEHIKAESLKKALLEKKIYVSVRGKYLRISTHVFNTKNDFTGLMDCLRGFV